MITTNGRTRILQKKSFTFVENKSQSKKSKKKKLEQEICSSHLLLLLAMVLHDVAAASEFEVAKWEEGPKMTNARSSFGMVRFQPLEQMGRSWLLVGMVATKTSATVRTSSTIRTTNESAIDTSNNPTQPASADPTV
jgi:hypothetical protein